MSGCVARNASATSQPLPEPFKLISVSSTFTLLPSRQIPTASAADRASNTTQPAFRRYSAISSRTSSSSSTMSTTKGSEPFFDELFFKARPHVPSHRSTLHARTFLVGGPRSFPDPRISKTRFQPRYSSVHYSIFLRNCQDEAPLPDLGARVFETRTAAGARSTRAASGTQPRECHTLRPRHAPILSGSGL
jgi:hypothetical protein